MDVALSLSTHWHSRILVNQYVHVIPLFYRVCVACAKTSTKNLHESFGQLLNPIALSLALFPQVQHPSKPTQRRLWSPFPGTTTATHFASTQFDGIPVGVYIHPPLVLELNSSHPTKLVQDLDEAMPAYYASIKALDSLDKKSIQEMKSFTNPPQVR